MYRIIYLHLWHRQSKLLLSLEYYLIFRLCLIIIKKKRDYYVTYHFSKQRERVVPLCWLRGLSSAYSRKCLYALLFSSSLWCCPIFRKFFLFSLDWLFNIYQVKYGYLSISIYQKNDSCVCERTIVSCTLRMDNLLYHPLIPFTTPLG